ncbi:MAG: hypothetical protein FWC50_11325 [Planctomycetaceae bacterium]|nr:hypothetical protein [Planctomycetaceae bacterium]
MSLIARDCRAGFLVLALTFILCQSAQPGETIVYPGAPLQTINGIANSLGPTGSSTGVSNSLSNNSVTLDGASIPTGGAVFGAISLNAAGTVLDNNVFIINGGRSSIAFGGFSITGNVTGNTVTIETGSVVDNLVYGGYSPANVENNTVIINGGTVNGYIYGGDGSSGDVTGNTVTFNSGTTRWDIYGGRSINGDATGNTVTFNSGTVGGNVYGGESSSGDATGNTVIIKGGVIGNGSVGKGNVYGGYYHGSTIFDNGNAVGNNVMISGGTVSGNIYGGYTIGSGDNAVGNNVTISGGTVSGNIYGGYTTGNGLLVTNNTVTISGTPDLSASILYGGFIGTPAVGSDAFSGNTLNLYSSNLAVAGLQNFKFLNFYVPGTMTSGGIMLDVSGTADITDSIVNVGVTGGSSPLRIGDHIVLINTPSTSNLVGLPVNQTADGSGMQGVTLLYGFDVFRPDDHQNQLWARVNNTEINPQTKTFSEGFLGGTTLLNQSSDHIAGSGMSNAMQSAAMQARRCGFNDQRRGWGLFADIAGGKSRYNTGSHIDTSGLSFIAGASRYFDLSPGPMTIGMFFDYGNGSYDTFNSFASAVSVHGNGNLNHVGLGMLGRWDLTNIGSRNSHFYTEASFRGGNVHNKYTSDIRDVLNNNAGYTANSPYYSLHAGIGKIRYFANHSSLDLYGKYFWTQQQGRHVTLTTGDAITFDNVNSHRLRLGGRFAFGMNKCLTPYLGAAFEHEFDGKACAMTYGHAIDAPSLRGSTGVGELGISISPTTSRGFFADLDVQGYIGKREGATASLYLGKTF